MIGRISRLKHLLFHSSIIRTSNAAHPIPVTSPPLIPAIPQTFLPHFLQNRPVSGTPKGKARLKTIAGLQKKSFSQKKRKKGEGDPRGKGGRPLETKTRPIILRLNARLRRREAEREKLGLVSKLRQRDLEIMNARTASAKVEAPESSVKGTTMMGPEGMSLSELGYVDGEKINCLKMTIEEGRTLAKEYSRLLMRWDRERQRKEMELLRLRIEAINALPENLKRAALRPVVKKVKKRVAYNDDEKKKSVIGKGKGKGNKKLVVMIKKKSQKKG